MNIDELILFAEWCSINDWTYFPRNKEWRKFKGNGFIYYNSKELYEIFKNKQHEKNTAN